MVCSREDNDERGESDRGNQFQSAKINLNHSIQNILDIKNKKEKEKNELLFTIILH
jgi:hypothetical protein